jgi:pimeloyl-ACP methyl ester carboxylesterase
MLEPNPIDTARRLAYREQLQRILPASPSWNAWLDETGELPPDYTRLRSVADLPDPLEELTTHPACLADWQARREELKELFYHWVLGRVPPPPAAVKHVVLGERRESGCVVREVCLYFDAEQRARLRLELLIPTEGGPHPVFLTQHNHRDWAQVALRRGYLACVYAAADSCDDTDSFAEAYPGYDWSRLMRRAWAASRCVDYLATATQADHQHIVLTGHSRNGKQSLIAAAFDERISAVISSSSGAGGALTTRYFAESHYGEGIEALTTIFPDWFHPRLRFFTGREHKLPVDMHELVGLIAPRPCLLSTALNDGDENPWSQQQTYLAAQRVYRFLDADEHLRILWRPGAHETSPAIIERYLDWSDNWFGRGHVTFPERLIFPDSKSTAHGVGTMTTLPAAPRPDVLDDTLQLEDGTEVHDLTQWARRKQEIRARVHEVMGAPIPTAARVGTDGDLEPRHVTALLNRDKPGDGLQKRQVVFGDELIGDIYLPADAPEDGQRLPAVLWLHPFSSPNGYYAYYSHGDQVFRTLARAGFAVCCFDQIGYGRRLEEVEGFYKRYPSSSLLGHMVRDSRAALDMLATLPYVASDQIYGVGYSLGSLVGLHLGALDERLAGFASVCGPPPFRTDVDASETGGIHRWSDLHCLVPQLSKYIGRESCMPYDVHQLFACFAPRPFLVVSPELDREAPRARVEAAVEAARQAYTLYGAPNRLEQRIPETYNQMGLDIQAMVAAWLKEQTAATVSSPPDGTLP